MYSTNARSPKAVFSRNVQEQEFQFWPETKKTAGRIGILPMLCFIPNTVKHFKAVTNVGLYNFDFEVQDLESKAFCPRYKSLIMNFHHIV